MDLRGDLEVFRPATAGKDRSIRRGSNPSRPTGGDFARTLGAAARRSIQERFTVEQMVRGTIEVYRGIGMY